MTPKYPMDFLASYVELHSATKLVADRTDVQKTSGVCSSSEGPLFL